MCLAQISMATFAKYKFAPMPAVAVMPVVSSTSSTIFRASSRGVSL